jgi:hypothetical protein
MGFWVLGMRQKGVTEEQMLKLMGAATTLSPKAAVQLIEVSIQIRGFSLQTFQHDFLQMVKKWF